MLAFLSSEYVVHLLILIGIYVLLAQSLNVTFGLGQLFNLAHVAAYGIGAYTTALLATDWSAGMVLCMTASVLISGVLSLALGLIAMRLTADYFAIATIACTAIVSSLFINWKSLTRGVLGIPGIPRPELGFDMYDNYNFLWLTWSVVLGGQVLLYIVQRGRFGRSLRAIAEHEKAALAVGRNAVSIRNVAFVLSSAAAGLSGSLFAYYINYIDPSSFTLTEMIFVLTIVVVGRPGSFYGVIGASFFLVLLPEPLRFIDLPSQYLGPLRQLLHACILFGVVWVKRAALFPSQRRV
jgi:branched-chain amino acid transport system permease protein